MAIGFNPAWDQTYLLRSLTGKKSTPLCTDHVLWSMHLSVRKLVSAVLCAFFWVITWRLQTPGNYPKEDIQHTEHGESLKSRIVSATKSCVTFS